MTPNMTSGARLAYVVVALEGEVKRPVTTYAKDTGLVTEERAEPAGFLVYFPRGHVLRFANEKALKHYQLDRPAKIINLQGLNDPNSPIGQLMASQDDEARRGAMQNLKESVIKLATAKTGPAIMPEMLQSGQIAVGFAEHEPKRSRKAA